MRLLTFLLVDSAVTANPVQLFEFAIDRGTVPKSAANMKLSPIDSVKFLCSHVLSTPS